MMPATKLAIDFGQWDKPADIITPEQVKCWRDHGVAKAIIGIGYHDAAIQQMQVCAAGGLAVEVYRYLFWYRPIEDQINYALETIADSGVSVDCLWIDCEGDVAFEPPYVVELIQNAVTAASTFHSIGIYTRKQWWEYATANTEQFAHLPLWHAQYDGVADLSGFKPFGGWWEPQMKQYAENVNLCGRTVDLNIYI